MNAVDVLVVGAGPAGSVAAGAGLGRRAGAARRSRPVSPPKLCGDTLNPGAFAVLQAARDEGPATGLVCPPAYARPAHRRHDGIRPGRDDVTADYPDGVRGCSISRSELDLMLVERAAACGVDIAEGVRAAGASRGAGQCHRRPRGR